MGVINVTQIGGAFYGGVMRRPPAVLTVAGSDPSGGAGLQADLKTIGALGGYGMAVVTALTAQNTHGVDAVHAIPADFVAAQCDSLIADVRIDAVKTGMLASAAVTDVVCEFVRSGLAGGVPVVVDPVMVAKSEDPAAFDAFGAELIDRFGPLPPEVDHLLKVVFIKALCRKANVEKLDAGPKGVVVQFRDKNFANPAALVRFIGEQGVSAKIRPDQSIVGSWVRMWMAPARSGSSSKSPCHF